MKKILLLILLTTIYGLNMNAQSGFEDTFPGPFLCGIEMQNLNGNNGIFTPDYNFSCGVPHNNGWVNFYADEAELEFKYNLSNCIQNEGLQLVIFDNNGSELTCFSLAGTLSGQISAVVEPCEKYILMIDGFNGDVCDFVISNTKGINANPDIYSTQGETCKIDGPTTSNGCSGPNTAIYNLTCPLCVNLNPNGCAGDIDSSCLRYVWDLPQNMTIIGYPTRTSIEVKIDGRAFGYITVSVEDDCENCGSCSFYVEPLFVDIGATVTFIDTHIPLCREDSIFLFDEFRKAPDTIITPTPLCKYQRTILKTDPNCTQFLTTAGAENDSCTTAPFLCGEVLDSYSFYTDVATSVITGNLQSVVPYDIDNNYWLSWTPCETTVDFQITPVGCVDAKGIEVAVLQTPDCDNFSLIDYTTAAPGSSNWVVNNLTPGDVYYLMFDGIDGDDCFVTIEVNSGVSLTPTQFVEITPGSIDGPEKLCPDEIGTYTLIQPVLDIIPGDNCPFPDSIGNGGPPTGNFVWSIPDKAEFVGDSTSNPVQIVFPMDSLLSDLIDSLPINDTTIVLASGQVYPTWSTNNPNNNIQCNASGSVTPIPPKDVEVCVRIENKYEFRCEGDPFTWYGQFIWQDGVYFHYENCVLKILTAEFYIPTQYWGTVEVCPGECFVSPITGYEFCDPGFNFNYDFFNCIEEYVDIEIINDTPISTTLSTQCAPDGYTFDAIIEINPANSLFTVDGIPINGNIHTISNIPNGEIRNILITENNSCDNNQSLTIEVTTPQIIENWGTINLCAGECYESPLTGLRYCDEGAFVYVEGCIEESGTIVFESAAQITATASTICAPDGQTYTATINLDGGEAPYFIDGLPVSGNSYTVSDIPISEIRNFTISDNSSCTNDQPLTVQSNSTLPPKDWGEIILCQGECFESTLTGEQYCDAGAFAFTNGCFEENGTIVFENSNAITVTASTDCAIDGQTYSATINLGGGEAPYFIDGIEVNSNTFQIDNIPNGEIRNLIITDNSSCTSDQTLIVEVTTPSEIRNWGEIKLCQGECFESPLTGLIYCNEGNFAISSGCLEESGSIVFDSSDPIIASTSTNCSPNGDRYDATVIFSGGQAPYFVDGIELTGNSYTISDIPNGESRSFIVADNSSCNNDESINIQENCGIFGAPMGDSCATAPFLCGSYLDGWNFTLNGLTDVSSAQLDDIIPFSIENNAWVGWTPCESFVEFSFDVENCANANGIEIAIVQTPNCQTFSLIDYITLGSGTSTWAIDNITPGDACYFMFDGVDGDNCGIQINVISGISTDPGQFNEITPGYIDGPDKLCPDQNGIYTLIPPVITVTGGDNCPFPDSLGVSGSGGQDSICWHIPDDADFVGDSTGTSIEIVFPLDDLIADLLDSLPDNDTTLILTSGLVFPEYKLDSTFNDNVYCGVSGSLTPIDPRYVEVCIKIEHEDRTICEGASFDWNGQTINASGVYTNYNASDCLLSVLTVYVIQNEFNDWGVIELCPGDCFSSPASGWTVCDEGTFYNSYGQCSSEQVTVIFNNASPMSPTWSFDCEPDGLTYSVTIVVSGGQAPYFIDGNQFSGSYTISGILSGDSFSANLSDSNSCSNSETISDQYTCPVVCPYDEGRMSNSLLETCDPLTAKTEHLGGEQYPSEGTFEYILHTNPGSIIGDIIARNKTGEFSFDENQMDYETTYYVSYAVGLNIGGAVDLDNQCTKVTVGQPIVFHKTPSISAISATPITCRDSVSTLTVMSDATEFLWSNSAGFTANQQTTQSTTSGTFSILVTNEYGCEMTSSIDVIEIEPEIEDAIFEMTDPICFDDKNGIIELMDITGTADELTIFMNNEEMPNEDTQFDNLGAGTYNFEIFDKNGCSIQKEMQLINPMPVEVDLGNDFTVIRGMSISLEPIFNINPTTIDWNVPSGEEGINAETYSTTPMVSGNYSIEITDANGCPANDQIYVTVEDKVTNIYVPSAFSPNNDGQNDYFEFYSNDVIEKVISLRIYSRWGDLVYIQKDYAPGENNWDGTYKGQPLNSGVYSYVLELLLKDGTTTMEKGDLTLMK